MNLPSLLKPELVTDRRGLLRGVGTVTLSVAAVSMLVGCEGMAADTKMSGNAVADDINVLNTGLGLEYEAIAAYQVGAESGLLQKPVLALAVQFQSDHKKHAEVLSSTIVKLGGTPVMSKTVAEYQFPTQNLHNQADVLKFAAGLEKGAASGYLGTVAVFNNRDLARAAASILGDEAMHWAVLLHALGMNPDPAPFIA